MKRNAFTLIEIIVVIAVLLTLAAILFPVFTRAKLAAKRSVSISNVRQLQLSIALYRTDHDGDGSYGRPENMGLPPMVDVTFDEVLGRYGYTEQLRESPCGWHQDGLGAIWDNWTIGSWPTYVQQYEEASPVWIDVNCNDSDERVWNNFQKRRGIAALLSGTVVARIGTGDLTHPSFYSPTP